MSRQMKDSGIQIIGDIPDDMDVTRIKYVAKIFGRIGFRGYTQDDFVNEGEGAITLSPSNLKDFGMSYDKCSYISWSKYEESPEIKIENNDILFVKTGSSYGKSCLVENLPEKATINPQLIVLKNIKCNNKYLFYLLQTDIVNIQTQWYVAGGTIPTMSQDKIANMYIPFFKDNYRQRQIVAFLDRKCSAIDAAIKKTKESIEKLEEYKKAVITKAVTRGLDPNAKMKDSGLGWIGSIPESWSVSKFKYHTTQKSDRNPGNATVLSLYREHGIVIKDSRDDNHNRTSLDTSSYRYVEVNDFVVNKMKAWQGSVAVSEYEGIVSPAYYVYRITDKEIYPRYFHYLLRSCYKDEFMRLSSGIRIGQWDLPVDELGDTMILKPSFDEQKAISEYIDKKNAAVEELIAKKQEVIIKLEEYKKSLIFYAVTGKIDCRNEAV